MLKVGITGGIGSGKTTVCKIFEVLGIPVYYADERAKELMHTDKLKTAIKELFGEEAYLEEKLNRTYIASRVFNDKPLLEKLNGIVHPAVAEDVMQWMMQHTDKPYVLEEAALLFESGSYRFFDKIITVYAPLKKRLERVRKRDNISDEQILARMKNQLSDEEKVKKSDFVVYNDERQMLISQVLEIHRALVKLNEEKVGTAG